MPTDEVDSTLPFGCRLDPKKKSAHGLAHHRLECECDVCYPPASMYEGVIQRLEALYRQERADHRPDSRIAYDPYRIWECDKCGRSTPENCVPTIFYSPDNKNDAYKSPHPCGCGGTLRQVNMGKRYDEQTEANIEASMPTGKVDSNIELAS